MSPPSMKMSGWSFAAISAKACGDRRGAAAVGIHVVEVCLERDHEGYHRSGFGTGLAPVRPRSVSPQSLGELLNALSASTTHEVSR
jgi:hypothetical protein